MIKVFITYLKQKRSTGEIYAGRTSGNVEQIDNENLLKILDKRDILSRFRFCILFKRKALIYID